MMQGDGFSRGLRGYDTRQVDEKIAELSGKINALSAENAALREKMRAQNAQIAHIQELENMVRDAMLAAQKSSEETARNAQRKAELVIESANAHARQITRQANEEAAGLRTSMEKMRQQTLRYAANLRVLLESQLTMLDENEMFSPPPKSEVLKVHHVEEGA